MKLKFSPVILALVAMACLPLLSSAGLVVIGPVTNDPLHYAAHLQWTSPTSWLDSISNIGGVGNWTVTASANPSGFSISTAQHQIAPHFGETAPGPSLVVTLGGLAPGSGAAFGTDSEIHGGGLHYDILSVTVTPGAGVSDIYITADHVPEPATAAIWLFAAGTLGFAARRRSRRS
jgi:hypothetical protein